MKTPLPAAGERYKCKQTFRRCTVQSTRPKGSGFIVVYRLDDLNYDSELTRANFSHQFKKI